MTGEVVGGEYIPTMEEMEEMVPPPAPDQSPEEFANAAFADMKFEMLHEAIEGHYEALCAAIDSLADIEQDRLPFVLALLDAFSGKVGAVAESLELDVKSLRMVSPETVRNTERRLRDAIGLSRSDAKRLAPEVWNLLRDADQETGSEPIAEVEVKSSPDSERDDILARLGLLMELQ